MNLITILDHSTKDVDMVKLAAKHTHSGKVDPQELAEAQGGARILLNEFPDFLPIEKLSEGPLTAKQRELVHKACKLDKQRRIHEFSEGDWKIQDLEPLRWRTQNQHLPVYAVFSLDNPVAKMTATVSRPWGDTKTPPRLFMSPAVPRIIQDCFADVAFIAMREISKVQGLRSGFEATATLETSFMGLIPKEVKDEIDTACYSKLFTRLYLVAEVKRWEWDLRVTTYPGDPLIIGYDGYQCWLIKAFDTTSFEQIMAEKFSHRPWNE